MVRRACQDLWNDPAVDSVSYDDILDAMAGALTARPHDEWELEFLGQQNRWLWPFGPNGVSGLGTFPRGSVIDGRLWVVGSRCYPGSDDLTESESILLESLYR